MKRDIKDGELFLQEELYWLTVLEQISPKPQQVKQKLDEILSNEDIAWYYQDRILTLLLPAKHDPEA